MSRKKLRVRNTEADNLVCNLRGEVGEIVTSWLLMRGLMAQCKELETGNARADMENPRLRVLYSLVDKLRDEIVARLAELGEKKVGRLTFYFAELKLGCLGDSVEAFRRFVKSNRLREKRNYDVSHKELPEKWSDHKHIRIPYRVLLQAIAMAVRMMKRIDRHFLGPSAKYLWREMRKRRYSTMHPARTSYMILPHLNLSPAIRAQVIEEETREGLAKWEDIETTVNGRRVTLKACRKWGGVILGGRLLVLEVYPLVELKEVTIEPTAERPTQALANQHMERCDPPDQEAR